MAASVNLDTAMVVLQLFNNSAYMVAGPGGEKKLPAKDRHSTFHIDGELTVTDKPVIKSLVAQLTPLLTVQGNSRKVFLTPLARYWVRPCCDGTQHHTSYSIPGYLLKLGEAVHALCGNIHDSLYKRHIPNFRMLCPNHMVEVE
jgi:hypothetical protein